MTEAARLLGMGRVTLSHVLNGRADISPDFSIRFEQAGVSTARFWVNLKASYDLAQVMKHEQPPVEILQAT